MKTLFRHVKRQSCICLYSKQTSIFPHVKGRKLDASDSPKEDSHLPARSSPVPGIQASSVLEDFIPQRGETQPGRRLITQPADENRYERSGAPGPAGTGGGGPRKTGSAGLTNRLHCTGNDGSWKAPKVIDQNKMNSFFLTASPVSWYQNKVRLEPEQLLLGGK